MIRKLIPGMLAAAMLLALMSGRLALSPGSTSTSTADAATQVCTGDVNGDGVVNLIDLVLVAVRIGARAGGPAYDPRYDVNNDGRITFADLRIVISQFGTVCDGGSPTPTATRTATPTSAATGTATATFAATYTATHTATATSTPTDTPSATPTSTFTATPTDTAIATATNTPTDTPATATPTATATATSTEAPTATATATPTATPRNGLPPDPAAVAPDLDRTIATDVFSSTQFLYSGSDPIQTGVSPGTIELQRAAVLRGRVLDRAGQPLPGVEITILDHPELGQTLSRDDGMFDMAVNGGGQLTLRYAKDGYASAQRAVDAPWQDFAWAPDVVLVPYDTIVTAIDLGAASMQTARGSAVTDADGTRQATLLFPQGTTAELVLPDGSTQSLSTLNIRATEYTVGDTGPQAMPAALPPSSGYTYAVELSADEAIAANASAVSFNQPLPVYVENFVGFPVGGAVPAGYYDREAGRWVASSNGRVIEVVSITGGLADLDIDGDALADDASAIGVTDAERGRLASLYAPGAELWRVPVSHFSPWDFNWPYGPPSDSIQPPTPKPQLKIPEVTDPCISLGSVIGCENQSLGESVPVTGTDWSLHYQSNRTPGRRDKSRLEITVSDSDPIPPSMLRMRIEVEIAGRLYKQSFAPAPDLSWTFFWDGIDGYGRQVQGSRGATVTVLYDYQPQYYPMGGADALFAFMRPGFGGLPGMLGARETGVITAKQSWRSVVGAWDARAAGFGGWTLNNHHAYDPTNRVLLLGDGRQRSGDSLATIVTTIAGTASGSSGYSGEGDGGPATAAPLQNAGSAVVAPDGTVYFSDGSRVRRVGTDGIITTYAGGKQCGYVGCSNGDGGPATAAYLNPGGLALAPDGSLYITDLDVNSLSRIRRVGPDGIITTFAGNGTYNFCGDGGPATSACLAEPFDVAVGPDGSVYIADFRNYRIRRVGSDGIITTFAGNGGPCNFGSCGEGGPAAQAQITPYGVTVAPDGSVYISDGALRGVGGSARIRRVTPDGIIETVAGGGSFSPPGQGEGGPALDAWLNGPSGLAVGQDGSVYFADDRRIKYVSPDGILTTVASNGALPYYSEPDFNPDGDGGPALAVTLQPNDVSLAPDGSLVIADSGNYRIRRVAPALPDISISDVLVPSEDGLQLYVFAYNGRHLRTLDALTGAVVFQFAYDAGGYLTSVTDGSGNVTTIERAGAVASAIVAPGGQRTELAINSDGWLTSIANPAVEAHTMSYWSGDGLLQTFTDPMTSVHTFTYDALGRLVLDQDPAGGSTALARTEQSNGYTVTTTSALGKVHAYKIELLPTGQLRRTATAPGGAATVLLISKDGSRVITYPDGVRVTSTAGPDPRFGMMAARLIKRVRTVPGGQTENLTGQRTVTLADPGNLLSLQTLTDTVTVNGTRTFTRTYDAATRTLTETSAEGRQIVTVLDALGRVASHTPASAIAPIVFTYDGQGRIIEERQGSLSLTYGYDVLNRLTTRTDAAGHVTEFAYDAADRVTTMTLPSGRAYQYGYDANGNRTGVTMPGGQSHALSYTSIDLESSYTPPGNSSYARAFNADRELTGMTLPGGRTTSQTYDALDRVTGISYPEGNAQFSYAAGDLTDRVSLITNTPGAGPSQDIALTYNGSLITGTTATGASPAQATYAYNNNFLPTSMDLTSGTDSVPAALTWDRDGLMTGFGPFTFTRSGPGGAPGAITADGALSTAYGYDTNARLASRSQQVAGQARYSMQLSYDAGGRLTGKTETIDGTARAYVYTYDLDGQLTEVTRDGVAVERYGYDANGNRTSRQLGAAPAESASYDSQDRLTGRGGVTYQFNSDGFLAQRGTDTFQYNTRGQLTGAAVGAQSITYAYDGLGRRVSRTDNNGTYRYIYGDPASHLLTADRDPNGVFTYYYYDTDGLLIALQRGATRYYVATDQAGTPRIVTDASGAVIKVIESDSFGVVTADSNPSFGLPVGYAGGLVDEATGLVLFGSRDYEPASGRWTARDPIGFDGGQGNLYAYVGSSPVQHRDPTGLFCISVTGYSGVGGGVTTCITDEGASVCGEVGFGVGASAGVDSGGLDETGLSVVAEASLQAGPAKLGGGLSLDSSGCLKSSAKAQLGPVVFDGDPASGSLKKAGLKLNVEDSPAVKIGKNAKVKAQAKVAAKGCVQGKW